MLFAAGEGMGGLFYGAGVQLLIAQVVAVLFTLVFTGVMTFVIAIILKAVMGLRVSADDEERGVDLALHRESAYDYGLGTAYNADRQGEETAAR